MHPAELSEEELLRDCGFDRTRRRGPGGQHRNKVETAVVVTHRPTNTRAEASERRSQAANRRQAIFRLRLNLALTQRVDRKTPTPLWRSRCRNGRISVNASHEDFPAVLALALDVISQCQFDVAEAAAILECSTSQLVKVLKTAPAAMALVNEKRKDHGLRPLK